MVWGARILTVTVGSPRRNLPRRVRAVTADLAARYPEEARILIVAHHDWIRVWFSEHLNRTVSLRNAEVVRAVWPVP